MIVVGAETPEPTQMKETQVSEAMEAAAMKHEARGDEQTMPTPLQSAMSALQQGLTLIDALSEKLASKLEPVMRGDTTRADDGNAKLASVEQPSEHVRAVWREENRVEAVADRLRSLIERVDV